MKRQVPTTPAQQIVRRISELRDLSRRLARAGFQAGLHRHDLNRLPLANKIAEGDGAYSTRRRHK